jgi:uncharacterized protein (DUF1800 family)
MSSLTPFNPTTENPWDRRKAAHLLQRAGFGPHPDEIEAVVRDGLEATVRKLVEYDPQQPPYPPPAWVAEVAKEQPPELMTQEEQFQLYYQMLSRNAEMKAWWLRRMAFTAHPLQEKMTLFWHGHFTTEARKVVLSPRLLQQNEFLRANALSDFRTLLRGISRDPAMLRYLDNQTNKKEHPNENYARELLELFSMGIGNYSEDDVKAAARAFTGWSFGAFGANPPFRYLGFQHDGGEKQFLGRRGNWNGDDIIEIVLEQPVTARFIAGKLVRFFVSDEPDPALVDDLATTLRQNNYQFKPAMRALFRSQGFYDPAVIGGQIKSPVQLVVGAWRQLRAEIRQPMILRDLVRLMSQDILDPPNVKGWDGGRAWITTSTLATRQNLHRFMLEGKSLGSSPGGPGGGRGRRSRPGDPLPPGLAPDVDVALLYDPAKQRTPEERVDHFLTFLLTAAVPPAERQRLLKVYEDAPGEEKEKIRAVIAGIMQLPHYQLC